MHSLAYSRRVPVVHVLRAALTVALWSVLSPRSASADRLVLWHAWRGDEQRALEQVLGVFRRAHPGTELEVLAVPFEAYASKLESAIPHGHGPDVFIDAHERVASYRDRRLLAGLPGTVSPEDFEPSALSVFTLADALYALPLSVKCAALYINTELWNSPLDPPTLESITALSPSLPAGRYAMVYEAQSAYFHAALAHAYGSGLLDDAGHYLFVGRGAERSVEHVLSMLSSRAIPEDTSGALVSELFASGRAVTAISDSSLAAELGARVPYRVIPLPRVAGADGRAMEPFATVEGVMVSSRAQNPSLALEMASFLVSPEASRVRALVGHQVVLTRAAWLDPALATDPLLSAFRRAARGARPMSSHPSMRAAWEPARRSLVKALRRDRSVRASLFEGQRRFISVTRPLPRGRDPAWALLALGLVATALTLSALGRARDPKFRRALRRSVPAYAWVLHAGVIVSALVVVPLVLGAATSLYATREGHGYYVGLANYIDILSARGGPLFASGSFYRVLAVTVLWTAANITLHLALGVLLALALSRPGLKLKALYRVLLIVPWAVPSYVTGLAWKGMFHRQFGAVNAVITWAGGEPVSWFSRFSTAFLANLLTNVWLGFPFMMVVTLGALAAIPRDLYEAAAVDGASAWERFWQITVPMLRPSLGPAVALGAVWTFNQFNVVFLVSGGEPDGETEILVSEAYRWAFTRQAQYGYAAAYAVLIFLILAIFQRLQGVPRGRA